MKKLKSYFLLLSIMMMCSSCDLDYDGETKIVYEGTVTDAAGDPLAGVPVSIFIQNTGVTWVFPFIDLPENDVISYTTTDDQGKYKMVFPKPKNDNNITLLINKATPASPKIESLSQTTFYNLMDDDEVNYKVYFETARLYQAATSVPLTILLNPQTGAEIEKINFVGLVENHLIDYNYELPLDSSSLFADYFNTPVNVAPIQVLTLKYLLVDSQGNPSYQEAEITVGTQPLTFTLTY